MKWFASIAVLVFGLAAVVAFSMWIGSLVPDHTGSVIVAFVVSLIGGFAVGTAAGAIALK